MFFIEILDIKSLAVFCLPLTLFKVSFAVQSVGGVPPFYQASCSCLEEGLPSIDVSGRLPRLLGLSQGKESDSFVRKEAPNCSAQSHPPFSL